MTINEETVQELVARRLTELGWTRVSAEQLQRSFTDVFIESDVRAALVKLNPIVAQDPLRTSEIMSKLRAVTLSCINDGLIAANQEMTKLLTGRSTHSYIGTDTFEQVKLIDFANPKNNIRTVSTEVTFQSGANKPRRYDIVLWVNGIPLVVGETKTPDSKSLFWLNGAIDISNAYETKTTMFFVPNVMSFATEGKEFRYGAVGQPPETWLPWLQTTEEPPLPGISAVYYGVDRLLTPRRVLDVLHTYTFYQSIGPSGTVGLRKIVPRYPQVEAVEAIVDRVKDPVKKKGLIWHHQGSGKTLLMAFAAAQIRQELDLDAPTILVVLDRLELIEQTIKEFSSVGLHLKVAETGEELRTLLRTDTRGIIATTIYRFKGAGKLNVRSNIVVMVDEAHRTQEGRLGTDMREALPNAKFIGLTGTPISVEDRNTWETFGDKGDPEGVLNHYSVERSISDGATLPMHIETRLIDFQFDKVALDQAFDELAEEYQLDEKEQGTLVKQGTHLSSFLKSPRRIEAVCADILTHYRSKIAPLGLNAQIVVYDRALCVDYYNELTTHLEPGEEATVIMSCAKDDPIEWAQWDVSKEQETLIKERFLDPDDPLKFLIVTAKLLAGFDAPIEGVMYLDKPLRRHTLFQAVCRTNRRYTNPRNGQEKLYGLIVDYVGLGEELAKAVAARNNGKGKTVPANIDGLFDLLSEYIDDALSFFTSVDRTLSSLDQLFDAQSCIQDLETREAFAEAFLRAEGLFELLSPDVRLRKREDDYRWLAKIYHSISPGDSASRLLWHRLGAKTTSLIYDQITDVTIRGNDLEAVAIDADALQTIKVLGLGSTGGGVNAPPPTAEQIMNTLEARLSRKLNGTASHPVWKKLSERLEALRKERILTATASHEFIKRLLGLATELVGAEKSEAVGSLDDFQVTDPDVGALTQILREYAPETVPVMVERVVADIDAIVRPVRNTGWQESQPGDRQVRREIRLVLKEAGLPPSGELFDKAYAYVREHY